MYIKNILFIIINILCIMFNSIYTYKDCSIYLYRIIEHLLLHFIDLY